MGMSNEKIEISRLTRCNYHSSSTSPTPATQIPHPLLPLH